MDTINHDDRYGTCEDCETRGAFRIPTENGGEEWFCHQHLYERAMAR